MYRRDEGTVRVLHVDDDPEFLELSATFLERVDERLTVVTAENAEEGTETIREGDIDCVISDFDMPGQTGIEFLETVRERRATLPFILFTGKGSEEVAEEAISAGVTDYLQKRRGTEQYTVLANRVINAVDSARAERERSRQLKAIETAQEGIAILSEEERFIFVNGAYAALYGYDHDELIGEHWGLLYRDEDLGVIEDEVLPYVEETGHWHGTTTGLRADGSIFLEDHVLSRTDDGELVCTVRDVTHVREQETRLEVLARRYDAIFESDLTVIVLLNTAGMVLEANPTARTLTESTIDDLVGESLWDTPLWPAEETEIQERIDRAADGETVSVETPLPEDADAAGMRGNIHPIRDGEATIAELLLIGRPRQ